MIAIQVVTGLLGAIGTSLGIWSFFQIRNINRRGKAPYFVFDHLVIDHGGASGTPGAYVYSYPLVPQFIDGNLRVLFDQTKTLPLNYPRDRVIGVVVRNAGSQLRDFFVHASDTFLFCKSGPDYEVRYKHDDRKPNREIEFFIQYEIDDGSRGTQLWKLITGSFELIRLKPKSLPKSNQSK